MEELHISLELLTAENENRKESDVRMKVSLHNSMVLLTANLRSQKMPLASSSHACVKFHLNT